MEPKIVSLPAFTVVGMRHRGKPDPNRIGQLWGQFSARVGEIQHKAGEDATYGVMYHYDEATEAFDYWASLKVIEAADLPAGMEGVDVPAAQYAVWDCTLPNIGPTYEQIQAWFADPEHTHADTPEFEYYGPGFDPQDPASVMSIYMPIK